MTEVRKIKHIFVIQGLFDEDRPTGEELYNDVIKRRIDLIQSETIKMTHAYFDVKDKNAFIDSLKYIQANAPYLSGGLLIHFEMHGSSEKDGLVLGDSSLVTWKEIVELLRPINISTCNKLFVTLATCFGRYMYLGVDPDLKSPYQAYISASREVLVYEVLESFNTLFEILIDCGDLVHSYLEHEKSNSPFFYKDSLTIFEEYMVTQRKDMLNDPEWKKRVLDHPVLQEQLANGKADQATLDKIMEAAWQELVKRHADAFNFSDCE